MFKCFLCSAQFNNLKDLQCHAHRMHNLHNIKYFTCSQGNPQCLRKYSTLGSLYKHIKKVHLPFDEDTVVLDTDVDCSPDLTDNIQLDNNELDSDGDKLDLDFTYMN